MVRTMHTRSLGEFCAAVEHGELSKLAAQIGISRVYLSQLAARQDGREPSPSLCVRIEMVTGVSRMSMRKDAREIWPELLVACHGATL